MSGGGNTITAVGGGGCGGGSSVGGGGGSSGGGGGGPCGACKFLRRKCVPGCIFAPYFDSEQGSAYFAAVHKVFGASNVSKLLLHIPVHRRSDAVVTICYEAQARIRDPIYGCVAHIFALQQQAEVSYLQAHLASLELPQPQTRPAPLPQTQQQALFFTPTPPLSITDLPSSVSPLPSTYDLASIFDQTTSSSSWATQQRRFVDPRQQYGGSSSSSPAAVGLGGGNSDLQALAHELLHRQGSPPPAATDDSPSRSMSR
ncbi:LOB domain-containing protein 18 isoform X2 [Eutrema salsugineum]|uniref:LOB domain-containing protein 18 isoform X2 n=1 Tax=Eutrema salsugineum TaxID=72664 RepID=UPI000CECF473|nr:LOB domain-containing protein 18 isoform X2 [Eutrema salsugineum]